MITSEMKINMVRILVSASGLTDDERIQEISRSLECGGE